VSSTSVSYNELCCVRGFTIFIDLMFSCSACFFCTLHALLFDPLSSHHLTSGNFVVLPSYTHLCLVLRFSCPGIIVPPSCTLTHHTVTHQHFAYFLAQTCFYYILIHLSMCTVYYLSSPSALLHFLGTLCVLLDHSLVHG